MTSFHSITGHLFNRNISKEELNKSDSLLSTLNQQPNLEILGVWTIDSKQEKKLKKLNALAKKMRHYRGSSQAKRKRIGELVRDIRFLNAKLIRASSTPNSSPRPSCTPSSTTAQSNSELSHLHETSSTLSTASTAESSLELSEPSRYGVQGHMLEKKEPKIKVAVAKADNSTVSKPAAALSVTPVTDTKGNQTKSIHAQIADKKDELKMLQSHAKKGDFKDRRLESKITELKREILALSVAHQKAVTTANNPTVSKPAATLRVTPETDTTGNQTKRIQAQIAVKKNELKELECKVEEGGWKEERRLDPKIKKLKSDIRDLQSQVAVAKAGHPSISQPAVSRATHAPSRATQVTNASGNKNKIVQLNAKIVAKTNERRKLESEAKEGGWKEESRLKPKIRELKDEISSLQQELQALQSS